MTSATNDPHPHDKVLNDRLRVLGGEVIQTLINDQLAEWESDLSAYEYGTDEHTAILRKQVVLWNLQERIEATERGYDDIPSYRRLKGLESDLTEARRRDMERHQRWLASSQYAAFHKRRQEIKSMNKPVGNWLNRKPITAK